MAVFQAQDSRVQVNGQSVLSVIAGVGAYDKAARKILSEAGIDNPRPDDWFNQQDWLNAFRAISETIGARTLRMIGKSIPETAEFPPEIDNIIAALNAIDVAYHMNHRIDGRLLFDPTNGQMSEGIGHYAFSPAGERAAIVRCENPYPCEFDQGIILAMAERFRPAGSLTIKVAHEEGSPCRSLGGDYCSYRVSW